MSKSSSRDPSKLAKRIVAIGLVWLLLAPAVAGLFGVRSQAIENRKLARWPELEAHQWLDRDAISQLTRYLLDHLPLRDKIVRARAWTTLHVFGDSPSPDVHLGEEGWLFYDRSFTRACAGLDEPESIAKRLARASEIIEDSGRVVIVMIIPDKHAVYPEFLGASSVHAACAAEKRVRLRKALAARTPRGYADMWVALAKLKAETPSPLLYIPTDTHWSDFGAGRMVEAIVEGTAPGRWQAEAFVHKGQMPFLGDLTRMMGLRERVFIDRYNVSRKNIARTTLPASQGRLPGMRIYRASAEQKGVETSPIDARRVFLLHDSFMYTAISMISPFFEETAFSHWQSSSDAKALAQEIARSEIIVIEVAERGSYNWIHQVFSDASLGQLAKTLKVR